MKSPGVNQICAAGDYLFGAVRLDRKGLTNSLVAKGEAGAAGQD